jgi:hypothetical protein
MLLKDTVHFNERLVYSSKNSKIQMGYDFSGGAKSQNEVQFAALTPPILLLLSWL